MKKLQKILSIVLVAIFVCLTFCSCSNTGKSIMTATYSDSANGSDGLNLASSATYITQDGKTKKSFSLKGKAEENKYVTVDFGDSVDFNTVILGESGKKVTLFEIYGSNEQDANYQFLYQSDCIEGGHTCFLGDVKYRYLRIFVNQASGKFNVNNFEAYYLKNENANDLRVNAYLVAEDITEDYDFSRLDAITDIIIFGTAKFDEKGNIKIYDRDSNEVDLHYYSDKVNIVKKAIGDRDINLICDIAMPYGEENAYIISMMNDENVDNLVANIVSFVNELGFDGYDMDYEFPSSKLEWRQFNNFLRKLDKAMPDKIISLAIAPWDLQFDDDVIKIIDRAEVMLYDMFTAHNYHSIFSTTVNGIDKALKGGFDAKQIDLGVPFFSRPTNRHAYWGSYAQFEDSLDRYTNLIYYNDFDHDGNPMTAPQYINSVQMIADKTAFAIDAGLGGIMIWHMNCDLPYDNELSLFKAIKDTKTDKSAM